MLGKNLIQAAAGAAGGEETDENFANTVLLLHGDGNQGATNFSNAGDPTYLAFKDNSSNNFPITVNGDAYGDNFGPYALEDGNWSNYFDGSGDLLYLQQSALIAAGDFTVECFFYQIDQTTWYNGIVSTRGIGGSTGFSITTDLNTLTLWVNGSSVTSASLPQNTWHHVVITRSGTGTNNVSCYLNGTRIGQFTNTSSTVNSDLVIGRYYYNDANYWFQGYISNVRVVVGSSLYSGATITVPTTPLTAVSNTQLLTCQSNRFVDNSSNNFTITPAGNVAVKVFNPFGELPDGVNGSGYFDGGGDFIGYPTDTALTFGTGDYTVECWVYFTAINSTDLQILFSSGSTGDSFFFHADGNQLSVGTSSVFVSSQSATFVTGTWYHVAACRSGGTLRLFQNGVQVGSSVSDSTNWVSSGTPRIGANGIGTQTVFGYISNSRVVKGTALYTSAFTPPTAPLTNVTNTSLLTCQYAGTVRNVGFIDSGPYDFPITRVGNTTQGSFSPFSKPDGRWGNYFDGVDDTLISSGTPMNFGTGDFTFEMWIYPLPVGSFKVIVNTNTSGGVGGGINSNGTITIGRALVATDGTTSNSVTFNAWNHVAWVRNSGTVKIYINGVEGYSGSLTFNYPSGALRLGSDNNNTLYYPGYISNVRVSTSAVYTSGFTPSTSPLTTSTSPTILTAQSNRFLDNSGNGLTFTTQGTPSVQPFSPFPITTEYSPSVNGGSGYFDGSGDYLTAPDNAALELNGVPFCIEAWVYPTATVSATKLIVAKRDTNGLSSYAMSYWVTLEANGVVAWNSYGVGGTNSIGQSSPSNTVIANQWNHIAVTGDGTDIALYANGNRVVAPATLTLNTSSSSLFIGEFTVGTSVNFLGNIAGLRIVKGSQIYSGATYTMPTAPVTPVTNTSFLCNFTNAGIYDNTGFNVLETVGNAQIDTTTKKFGTGAMKFDGTGDYIVMPFNKAMDFTSSGSITVEFWMYGRNTTRAFLIGSNAFNNSTSNYSAGIIVDWTPSVSCYIAAGMSGSYLNLGSGVTANTWHHLAFVYDGSTTTNYAFLNGTLIASSVSSSAMTQTGSLLLGVQGSDRILPYNGFIDDLRITAGVARYTATFTPPDKAFPDIGS